MSVRDVFALVTLMGLYISPASGHQKVYKELLAYVDAGHALTLDDVQHAMIWYSRSKLNRVFASAATRAAPTPALVAALVSGATLLATIDALAAAILVAVRPTPLHAHRVAQAVALVAPRVVPIPIGLTRIRRPLRNTSSFGTIVACRRKPVAMPLCLSATTWSEQVLFEAGCTDYQDERAYPALAQAAENLMRMGCESTDDEDA